MIDITNHRENNYYDCNDDDDEDDMENVYNQQK